MTKEQRTTEQRESKDRSPWARGRMEEQLSVWWEKGYGAACWEPEQSSRS